MARGLHPIVRWARALALAAIVVAGVAAAHPRPAASAASPEARLARPALASDCPTTGPIGRRWS